MALNWHKGLVRIVMVLWVIWALLCFGGAGTFWFSESEYTWGAIEGVLLYPDGRLTVSEEGGRNRPLWSHEVNRLQYALPDGYKTNKVNHSWDGPLEADTSLYVFALSDGSYGESRLVVAKRDGTGWRSLTGDELAAAPPMPLTERLRTLPLPLGLAAVFGVLVPAIIGKIVVWIGRGFFQH